MKRAVAFVATVIVGLAVLAAGPGKKTKEAGKPKAPEWTVHTLAGAGEKGFVDGKAAEAKFDAPWGVAVDKNMNVWVSEHAGNRIRLIKKDGTVSTVAGSGEKGNEDGTGNKAQFSAPAGIALDAAGNVVVADSGNGAIRRVAPDGKVTTIAGKFKTPMGVAIDTTGAIFVADAGLSRIRKVLPDGTVEPFSGSGTIGNEDGAAESAKFYLPTGLAMIGKSVYVSDAGSNVVRRVSASGTSQLHAGSGSEGFFDAPSSSAGFFGPSGLVAAPSGELFVADTNNNHVRRIAGEETAVTAIAGWPAPGYTDGPGLKAAFNAPRGLAVSEEGDLVVADTGNNVVRIIFPPERDPAGLIFRDVVRKREWIDDADALKRGKADSQKVAEAIKANTEDVAACLAKVMEDGRLPKGSIVAILHVTVDGTLKDYDMKDSTVGSRNLETCVLNLVAKWKYPVPSKEDRIVVTHTFTFGK
ncbi:MAG: AgmX/PglI C-terminal domain-containing protein [Deltaproteobacteria bacterium]|nr:AgmX/PglI C-terminal domain-containing protein [Deltaproteobacteria bacterium]